VRQVLEVASYWGGELFSVDYVSPRKRLDVPDGLEVRTRLVDASPRMPRAPMDVPYLAIATMAACAHFVVVASYATTSSDITVGTRFVLVTSAAPLEEETAPAEARSEEPGARDEARPAQSLVVDQGQAEGIPIDEARDIGMVGLLREHAGDRAEPWAKAPSGDRTLWGDAVGEAFGTAGLSLTGIGQGGGGGGGLGSYVIERVHTEDVLTGHGHLGATHSSPWHCTLRFAEPIIVDRLPSESIRRVVHENLGRFRNCYEKGLARNPKLEGRVATKFVIARDGSVAVVADAGSELADAEVVTCIERTFSSLEFPEPPSGVVSVTYPIELSPE